jgi:hypothetical protein
VIAAPPPLPWVTVIPVEPEIAPDVAVIVVVPVLTAVANPLVPAVLLIVATAVADELQVTVVVTFWKVPSLNDPVAVNCWVPPVAIDEFAGVTANAVSVAVGVTVTVSVVETIRVAVRVTVCVVATVPAVVLNVVEFVLAGTVTDAGTGSAAVLLEPSVTVLPPVGAGWFKVTVQIVEMPMVRLSGLQTSEPTLGPLGVTVTVAVVLPPSVAVSVTVCEVVTVPAVGVKVVEVAAAGTVTDAGTGSAVVLFEASPTVAPPAGAA